MALTERLKSVTKGMSGLPCSVGKVMAILPIDELKALEAALANGVSGNAIHKALAAEGYEVGKQTVNRHRSQSCRCFS